MSTVQPPIDAGRPATTDHAPAALAGKPRIVIGEFAWIWIATAVLFAVSAVLAPGSIRIGSLAAMAPFASFLAIVAIGQTLVIRQRGLDMSSGGMMTFAGLFVAEFAARSGTDFLAVLATLAVCAGVGAANGLLVARVSISPIVATLATNALLIGGVRTISGGTPLNVPLSLQRFSHAPLFGVPMSVILAGAFVVVVALLVNKTVVGRRFVAVGANPATAAAAGVRITRYQVAAYAGAAVCFAVSGMMLAAFIGFASQSAGNDYLLPGIVAVVVGGTPFGGGRGSIVASAVAALFMAQLSQLVLSMGATPAVQLLVQAIAIVLAVVMRAFPGRLSRRLPHA